MNSQNGSQSSTQKEVEQLEQNISQGLLGLREGVEDFSKSHPRIAVGAALGLGFILGGGLTPRLLFGIGLLLGRRYARNYMRDRVIDTVRSLVDPSTESKFQSAPPNHAEH